MGVYPPVSFGAEFAERQRSDRWRKRARSEEEEKKVVSLSDSLSLSLSMKAFIREREREKIKRPPPPGDNKQTKDEVNKKKNAKHRFWYVSRANRKQPKSAPLSSPSLLYICLCPPNSFFLSRSKKLNGKGHAFLYIKNVFCITKKAPSLCQLGIFFFFLLLTEISLSRERT